MCWPVDWKGWIDIAVQCLPDLIETMELVEHVKSVELELGVFVSRFAEREGWCAHPPV